MSTMTVDFRVTGKSLDEIEQNAEKAAKELANGRAYTIEIGGVRGSYDYTAKTEATSPKTFAAHVTARMDGLPPSFSAPGLHDGVRAMPD